MPFEAPLNVIRLLAHFPKRWCVCGGWSIDFFLGYESRDHEDVEILVYRADQLELQAHLKDWPLHKVVSHGDGTADVVLWQEGEWLALPIHQIRSFASEHIPQFDFMLNECRGEAWAYRRNPAVTRLFTQAERRTASGVPFLSPELALLYKAHHCREKDQHDFDLVHARLGPEARSWLITALETCYPGHRWLDVLRTLARS